MLGSFLHNLRVPLRGHVMTALSAMLLSAAHRRRPLPGAFWRAGLVCAALKSVSPSAVLLGPMAAIAAEGFLMEAGAALLPGRAGLALGGGLAMAWIPVHLAGRALLLYGWDAARLFEAAWGRAALPLGLAGLGPWKLLGLLWLVHLLAGALVVGLAPAPAAALPAAGAAPTRPPSLAPAPPRLGPLSEMLALDLLLMLVSLRLLKTLPLPAAAALGLGLTAAWAWLYPGAARRLSRPGLWLGVLGVSAAAGWLLGGVDAGLRMALRALTLSAGFAALGQELAGPRVRARLAAWGAGGLSRAVEGAFASLPAFIARLPPARESLAAPGRALGALLDALETPPLFLVSGPSGSGKTGFLTAVAAALKERGVEARGILSPGTWKDGVRDRFSIESLGEGTRRELSRREGPAAWPRLAGPFHFSPEGTAFGRDVLSRAAGADVLIVDEVGPLELEGGGWAAELDRLYALREGPMLWAVRESLVEAVQARWGIDAERVWSPSDDPSAAAAALAAATRA